MKTRIFRAAYTGVAVWGIASSAVVAISSGALADHVDNRNFSDRDGETEFFVCVTPNHLNDRLVYNNLDRDFCNDVLQGHVEFMLSPEAGEHLSRSKILCYQRNRRCAAPETVAGER